VIRTAKQGLIDIIKNHGLYEDDAKILLEASTVLGKIAAVESLDEKRLIDASAVLLPLLQWVPHLNQSVYFPFTDVQPLDIG
jgi:hypothetical protein